MYHRLFWQMAISSQTDTILRVLGEGLQQFQVVVDLQKAKLMFCKQHNHVFLALCPLASKNFSVNMFWASALRIDMYLFSCGIFFVLKLLRPFFCR